MGVATERAERAAVDKFAARRRDLAESALVVIAQQGFANTGLRDISARTEVSTGILHYYFDSKDDLIAQAIWQYKSECARRYDPILETASAPDELIARFTDELASTLREEAQLHRLWYDLRNQAMFDDGFRATILAIDELLADMVWAVVIRHAELSACAPAIDRATAYALFDGLFLNALMAYLRGEDDVLDHLRTRAGALLASSI